MFDNHKVMGSHNHMSQNHTSQSHEVTGTMSDSDALLWTIGRDPVLRTTVVAVMVLDRAPRFADVRARVEELTLAVPRLRRRAVPAPLGWGRPTWVADEGFDLDLHLRRVVAASPATVRTVLDMAQVMGTTAFDPALPLWEVVLVEGVDGGRAALVIKLHHAVVDGVGGLAMLVQLLDRQRRPRRAVAGPAPSPAVPAPRAAAPWAQAAARGWSTGRRVVRFAGRSATDPLGQLGRTVAGARSGARLLAPARRPMSGILTGRSVVRRYEILDLDTDRMHQVAAGADCTLNDVFVAGVVCGLRRYHVAHDAPVDGLRVLMPVNVRTGAHAAGGNHFVPARFVIPVADDPAEQLGLVHRLAASWKSAPGLALSDVLAAGLDRLPPQLVGAVWGSMLKGDDFVATNIPGPGFETYLAGGLVERFYAFSPPSGSALNVSLVTPAGRACVGVAADAAAVPDPAFLVDCLGLGFDDVLGLDAGVARREAGPGGQGHDGTGTTTRVTGVRA